MSEDLFEQLKRWWRESADHHHDWREEAEECFAFVAADQWDPEDRALLKQFQRPIITFDRIGAVVDSVCGLEVNNRQEVRYIPREEGDAPVNELLSAAADWVRDECNAEDEESEAFYDMVVSGVGVTETRMDYDEEPDGKAVIERVDPLQVYWDGAARGKNYSDARHVFRVKDLPLDEAKSIAPDVEEAALDAKWAYDIAGDTGQPHDASPNMAYKGESGAEAEPGKMVRMVEAQWWEYGVAWDVLDPATGRVERISAEDYKKLKQRLGSVREPMPKAVRRRERIYKRALIGGEILLEWPGPKEGGFTLKAMTGKRDRNKGIWYGLVRKMRDPQRWANKWLSQTLHIINTNPKGGIMAERTAFENPQQGEESWAHSDYVTIMAEGALSNPNGPKVVPKPQAQFPAGTDRLMQFAISSIRDVVGVNLELLGMADRQQPGILEAERKRAGMTILAGMFDALRRYRKEQGKLLLWLITTFLTDGRLVRLAGESSAKYEKLVKQPGTGRYDVVIDDTPTSPNVKERTWNALVQMMPLLSRVPIPPAVWLEFMKYSPLPSSLVSKVSEIASQPSEPSKAQQIEEALGMAKVESERAGAELDRAKADSERQGSAIDVAETISGIGNERAEAERPPDMGGMANGHGRPRAIPFSPPDLQDHAAIATMKAAEIQAQSAAIQAESMRALATTMEQVMLAAQMMAMPKPPGAELQAAREQFAAAEMQKESARMQAEAAQATASALAKVAEAMRMMAGPKEIVRGDDGRAVSVRPILN